MAYPHGLFTWTDIGLPDPAAGSKFYSELFGWKAADQTDPDGNYVYTTLLKGDRAAAGLGPQPPGMGGSDIPPMWTSYITVDNLDETVAKWTELGGSVVMPAMDVFTAGRMAIVADPQGAVLAMWQAGDSIGGEVFNEHGAMTWNELATRDAAAAREFYGAALGWEFEKMGGDDAEMEYWVIVVPAKEGGAPLSDDHYNGGIMPMNENFPDAVPPHWMVYFHVDDIDATVAHLADHGGTVTMPPFDTPAGRMAVVADPQGGTFSLITPPQQTES